MSIGIFMEGGIGDVLLANRFVPAIMERHFGQPVFAYINSDGNRMQQNLLEELYPHYYSSIATLNDKKSKEFIVKTQFGPDNYSGCLENIRDETVAEMKHDVFYDLHIDSLKWIGADFDWLRYFHFFPRPAIKDVPKGKHIVLHLVSNTSPGHRLEKFYITYLCQKLQEFAPLKIISTKETNHFFDELKDVEIINTTSYTEIAQIIGSAKLMISTDSGFRFLAYGMSIPTIVFSKQSVAPHRVLPSHRIRWLLDEEMCFPLNYDGGYVSRLAKNIYEDPGYALAPRVQNFNNDCVRRIWEKM